MIDEIAALRAKNRELEARLNGSKPAQPPAEVPPPAAAENAPADDPEPDVDKYTDYVLFQKDRNRWDRRQELRREAAEKAKADAEDAERARATVWSERVAVAIRAQRETHSAASNSVNRKARAHALGEVITCRRGAGAACHSYTIQ